MLKNPIVHRILVVLGATAGLVAARPDLTLKQLGVMLLSALVGVGGFNITGVKGSGT